VQKVPVTALDPAHVNFRVLKFQDVLHPAPPAMESISSGKNPAKNAQCTPHKMSMSKEHPQVKIDPKDPDTLIISPKGATILFKITPDDYCPIGIAFSMWGDRKLTADDEKRLHTLNFAQMGLHPDERTLQVTDHFRAIGRDARYKFSVIIMRVKDGAIGIIDPGVVNES
jgi:hypothetical protein